MKILLLNVFEETKGPHRFIASIHVLKKDLGPRAFFAVLKALNASLSLDLENIEAEAVPVFRAVDYPNEGFDPRTLAYTAPGTHFFCRLCFLHRGSGAMQYTNFFFHFSHPKHLKPVTP